ncbi:MAG TPA: hypothetical protein VIG48_02060 [Jatrophihabitans sp.]|jgi:hypothetical protein
MEIAMLTLAVLLGGLALGAAIVAAIMEVIEAHDIHERGWVHGHHHSHGLRHGF